MVTNNKADFNKVGFTSSTINLYKKPREMLHAWVLQNYNINPQLRIGLGLLLNHDNLLAVVGYL